MSRKVAHVLSWVFNPGLLEFFMILAGVLATTTMTHKATIAWLLTILFLGALATYILVITWIRGMVLDSDLMNPVNLSDRSKILFVFSTFILLLIFISFATGRQQPLHAILMVQLVATVIMAVVTRWWKISIHMMGIAMAVTALLLVHGLSWWPLVLVVPLIAWARLALHRHTPLQLTGGMLVGFSITALVFSAYQLF